MSKVRKKRTTLSLDRDTVEAAQGFGINLSQVSEAALREAVKRRREEAWLEENRDAIEEQNERVRRLGAFSDGLRRF